jgi:hypothetical protein
LIKRIEVEIDQASWLVPPPAMRHPVPTQLTNYPSDRDLDFLRALLWIGVLSIPVRIPRWWLSIRWAQTRYLGIIDGSSTRLRLHPAAEDLDAHQTTVLSDDWGMGISLEWLNQTFCYSRLDHGASFLKRLERQQLARFNGPARRRGPQKCPDFVGVAPDGKLHLIECKGNQQGRRVLQTQLSDGRGQKQNVTFPDEVQFVGQRLVVGVAIAAAGARWNTVLRVEDPPPSEPQEEHYVVTAANAETLFQELDIGALARMLVLSGEGRVLARMLPDELEESGRDELDDCSPPHARFDAGEHDWVGRVDRVRLPAPIRIGDRLVRWFSVRHGVDPKLLERLARLGPSDREGLPEVLGSRANLTHSVEPAGRDFESGYAVIRWGDSFISDFILH